MSTSDATGQGGRSSTGGAAAAGGETFRCDLAAAIAVHIVAERPLWTPFPANAIPVRIGLETGAEADDIEVTTSEGRIWVQAKRSVALSSGPNSPLGAAVDQLVRQYVMSRPDSRNDRLVLSYSETTGSVRRLCDVIRRFHHDAPDPDRVIVNERERNAFARFRSLLNTVWSAVNPEQREMPWEDVQRLLRVLVFLERPEGHDGRIEGDRDGYLRDVVEHDRVGDAIDTLRSFMFTLATQRSGADLAGLRARLRDRGIPLREPPSFRHDMAALRTRADAHLRLLKKSQFLRWNEKSVPIPRSVAPTLAAVASTRSLAVVGEPGVGKSSLLVSLADSLLAQRKQVITLAASELGATDLGALQRELNLRHSVAEVLANIPDPRPAYLLIDSLDAAREHAGVKLMLRHLITAAIELPEHWRVVATVRRFDLLHNPEMSRLFALDRTRALGRGLTDISHLVVEGLDNDELESISIIEPALGQVLHDAAPQLRDLLRIPFNLRLAVEIEGRLAGVDSQRKLLERYWDQWIETGTLSERRAELMADLSRNALAKRTTRIPRAALADREALDALLHDGVVESREHGFVEASHHIVLDYAIARTVLLADVRAAVARLEGSAEISIFFRPSVSMWLESLWYSNRDDFWAMTALTMKSSMPGAARVAVAEAIIAAVIDPAELDPLYRSLQREATAGSATHTFRFLRGTLGAGADGPSLVPWLVFAKRLTVGMGRETFSGALALLDTCIRRQGITENERAAAGEAAREALAGAWATWSDLAPVAARAVLATMATSPIESATQLREALSPQCIDEPRLNVLKMLAVQTTDLLGTPDLVRDIYVRILELDTASSPLRRRDPAAGIDAQTVPEALRNAFSQVPLRLKHDFPAFLKSAPEEAAITVARVGIVCLPLRSWIWSKKTAAIEFDGRTVVFSATPSEGARYPDMEVIDALVQMLALHIASMCDANEAMAMRLLGRLADENAPGLVWATLMDTASGRPALAAKLDELLWQPIVFRLFPESAARLLRSRWIDMQPERHARVESAIEELAHYPGEDRLVEQLRAAITSTSTQSEDEDEQSIASFNNKERWLLAARGVSPEEMETPANRTVRDQQAQAECLLSSFKNNEQREDLVLRGRNALTSIADALRADGVHDGVRKAAWGTVAELATAIAHRGDDAVLPMLLEASRQPEPVPDEVRAQHFATSPGWGGGAARLEAVGGLCAIASRGHRDALARCIELASDAAPEVRYQVAARLDELMGTFPDEAWKLAKALSVDGNAAVAQEVLRLITHPRREDQGRVADLISRVLDRYSGPGPGHDHLRAACWAHIAISYVRDDNEEAARLLEHVVADVGAFASDMLQLLHSIRPALTYDDDEDNRGLAIRRRAIGVFERLTTSACCAVAELRSDANLNAQLRADRPPIAQLVGELAEQLYFASGAFVSTQEDAAPPTIRARFFAEAGGLLRLVGTCGIVEAAGHVLETLESALREHVEGVEPRATLDLFLDVVDDALDHGYENLWPGIDVIDKVFRWFLTEDASILIDGDNLARISSILDRFLDAGWPAAYRLALDLDQLR